MKRKLAIVDVETGGLDVSKHALLSVAVLIWNGGAIEDEYYTLIREEDIVVEDEAMRVNGLDLSVVREQGVTPLQAVNEITAMFQKHDMRRDIRIVAHNAQFDTSYMKRLWTLAGKDFNKTFSFRSLCTVTGALLLEQAERIMLPGGSASLDNLVKLWGIKLDRTEGHNALRDAHACAEVLRKEIKLVGGLQ